MPAPVAIRILKPLYGGAFSTDGGGAIPFVLPGELVSMAEAEGVTVVEASPRRVEPKCIHFTSCGGCHYQHAEYPLQLELKRQILDDLLSQAGLGPLPPIGVHHASEWGYRNRIRLRIEQGRVGYHRAGTNEFLPIAMCPIAAPLLWRAAESLLAMPDANAKRWVEAADEVEFFCLPDESRLQMTLFLGEAPRGWATSQSFAAWCEALRATLPQLAGANVELNPELNRRRRRAWDGVEWGAPGLVYAVAGREHWVSRGAFFQVNRQSVDRLVALVAADMESGALAWDLFAGVGLFTAALTERYTRVVAVEAGAEAARDLATAALGGKGRESFEAVRSPAVDFLRAQLLQRERPDRIVLDPPRAGLGREGAELLAKIAAANVVYVSCDPATLAADLTVLTRETYRVESVDLVDMFPQTFHMETVVRLARRSRSGADDVQLGGSRSTPS